MAYNRHLYKNNLYRNGEWQPNTSEAMAKEKRRSQVPSYKQYKYRQDLYEFCLQRGLFQKGGFPLARTKSGIASNISAFMTIIKKNGLVDEFLEGRKDNEEDS